VGVLFRKRGGSIERLNPNVRISEHCYFLSFGIRSTGWCHSPRLISWRDLVAPFLIFSHSKTCYCTRICCFHEPTGCQTLDPPPWMVSFIGNKAGKLIDYSPFFSLCHLTVTSSECSSDGPR